MKEQALLPRTVRLLNEHKLTLKKSLGQNFLVDSNVLQHIVQAAQLDQQTGVLEIGPGLGALTEILAEQAGQVVAIEADGRLIPVLQHLFAEQDNVHFFHEDIMKADLATIARDYFSSCTQLSVVANLPYYITTPILFYLLESDIDFTHYVLLMQKEVAERLTASPGTKAYGVLTLAISYYTEVHLVKYVPRTVFIPKPNVDSAVVKLKKRTEPPVCVNNVDFLFRLIKSAFAQRRKTLVNNLTHQLVPKQKKDHLLTILEQLGIHSSRRGETLTLEEFALLSDQLEMYE